MKSQLIAIVAAVVLGGCGPTVPDISMYDAAESGNIEAVKQHLAAGTDVNAKDKDGWTPLHPASYEGHQEIVELLIGKGADVNVKVEFGPFQGKTPLDSANNRGRTGIADLLRKHGATRPNFQVDRRRQTVTAFLVRSRLQNVLNLHKNLNQHVEEMFPVTNGK